MDRREFLQASLLTFADITFPVLRPLVNACGSDSELEIYVATSGSDESSGMQQKPFASLERARLEVRDRRRRAHGPITVWVRGGTYYLDAALIFKPEDSGTDATPIIYASYPGEIATLSGTLHDPTFFPIPLLPAQPQKVPQSPN